MSKDLQEPVFEASMNHAEGKGDIWIREGSYGYDIFVKGANLVDGVECPVALIDLFPAVSKDGRHKGVIAQVATGTQENVVYVRYGADFCVADFEGGVGPRVIGETLVYGYDADLDAFAKANGGAE